MKKKDEKKKNEKSNQNERFQTESNLNEHLKHETGKPRKAEKVEEGERTEKIERMKTIGGVSESMMTVGKTNKVTMHIKGLLETLWTMKNRFENEYEKILSNNLSLKDHQEFNSLIHVANFRFRQANRSTVL
jgi:hypothetical protein